MVVKLQGERNTSKGGGRLKMEIESVLLRSMNYAKLHIEVGLLSWEKATKASPKVV